MKKIIVADKEFKQFISSVSVKHAVDRIAMQIDNQYIDKEILFVSVLNGAFAFSADLVRKVKSKCQITFVKLASYEGTESTGKMKQLIGLNEDVKGRHIIIVEDIIDSGFTMDCVVKQLKEMKPASIRIASLLFKPQSYKYNMKIDYIGFEIANEFVIGVGLDYNGYGRNFDELYSLVE